MHDLAIQARGLTKKYGTSTALQDLDLEVPRESIFAVLGPNGAGKTTLFKILTGLVNSSSGEATVLGYRLNNQDTEFRTKIGYVAENPVMYGYYTALEMAAFCASLYPRWNPKLVETAFKRLDIPENKKIKELSHGQKSALALTLALGPEPELLILDEPGTGLDPMKRRDYFKLLMDQVVSLGGTVLISSHTLHEVERLADRVAFLNQGRLVMVKDMADLKTGEKRIRVVFQGRPPESVFNLAGIVRVEQEGSGYLLTVTENPHGVLEELSRHPHFALEIIDLDLEDIFLEYAHREEAPQNG
ncbi:MAG: ABC transporter ATP-binding protein [Syntrophomonas sp.]|nr:ABC transporter ATP-binding protein [Syntrophomonas sp.]